MSWRIFSLSNGLGTWCDEWDALNHRLYKGHPFRDSRFVDTMLRHFGSGSERLCIHRTQAQIDGMLLLYPRRFGRWTQFVPAQAQSAPVLIEKQELLSDLFPSLPGNAWMIELLCQDPDFAPTSLLEIDATTRVKPHTLTMNIELKGTFGDYWFSRSKNLIKNMRRYQRRIDDALESTDVRIVTDPEKVHDAVMRYGELETAGWKGHAGTAVNIANQQGLFYAEMMTRFAETGQAEVAEYWMDGNLAASRLVIRGGGISIILKTAYDESLAKFAPGRLLLKNYIEHAFAEKQGDILEFYTDASPDQLSWSTGQRHIYHAMFFRYPYQARIYDAVHSLKKQRPPRSSVTPANKSNDDQAWELEVLILDTADKLPSGCQDLFLNGELDSFDLSVDWYRLLESKAVLTDTSTRFCILQRNNEVRGVIPLFFRKAGIWGRQGFGMMNFYSSLYRPLLAPSVDVEELAGYLRKLVTDTRIDALRFDAMDPDHPTFTLLESALSLAGLKPYRFFCFGNWYLPIEGRSYQEYYQGLPSRVRNTVRRSEKKFLANNRGKLELITGIDGLEGAIAAWNGIYSASWKLAEPFPEFVPSLIRMCAARGWLRLGIAYYDGEPVAAQLWIVSHGRAAIYKLAFDERVGKLSPGTVLTAYLMAHVLEVDKVREVDYLIGDDAYKKDWMGHRRERWGIVAYDLGTARGLISAATQLVSESARRFRKMPENRKEPKAMKWTFCPVSEFDRYETVWDDLNDNGPKLPILNSRFLAACLNNFGSGDQVLALLGDIRHPDAMAVLTKRRGIAWNTFQPSQAPIGFWLMRPGLVLESTLNSLLEALPGVPLVVGMTQQDPLLVPRPNSTRLLSFDYIATARIAVEGDFEDYLASRGKNLRQNMRKVRNRLAKAGLTHQLRCITDPEEIQRAIEEYGRIEGAGWKSLDGTAVHPGNPQGRFYIEMLEAFCRAGSGRVYYLTVNDATVAMDLCITQGNMIVILKTTYDENFKEYSPAMLMHQEMFEQLFHSKEFRYIEFYGKVMEWHRRWTEDVRMMYHLNAYRASWVKILMERRIYQKDRAEMNASADE